MTTTISDRAVIVPDHISSLMEDVRRRRSTLPERDLRQYGLWRDRRSYFLNISYPSLQAMKEIDVGLIESRYRNHSGVHNISLYIHTPFCSGICSYCHYRKEVGHAGDVEQYMKALQTDLNSYARMSNGLTAHSIYIGGGSPSFLSTWQIEQLFTDIRKAIDVPDGVEITFEVHPEHATAELFGCLRRVGVNRLNIGVESFDDAVLENENRRHSSVEAIAAIELATAFGFENVNLDLIYGLPGQTVESWIKSIATASGLTPASICAYYLRIKETTPNLQAISDQS